MTTNDAFGNTDGLLFDDWGEAAVDPKILRKELAYRERAIKEFQESEPVSELSFLKLLSRNSQVLYQEFAENPQAIFHFEYMGRNFVGKKYMSDLCLAHGIPSTFLFCSLVKAPMILGLLERAQVTQDGVILFFKPLTAGEKAFVFSRLAMDREIDLYYPYAQLRTEAKLEKGSPSEGWAFDPERGVVMLISEVEQRAFAVKVLRPLLDQLSEIPVFFDPACSTGDFLLHLKTAFPQSLTVGQDLSPSMVEQARAKLDRVFVGDSMETPFEDGTADVLFFRFLNVEVVTSSVAYDLLNKLVPKVKVGGFVITFGYSPVLVSKAAHTLLGLRFMQANGLTEIGDAVFQFYVFQRVGNLEDMDFGSMTNNSCIYPRINLGQNGVIPKP